MKLGLLAFIVYESQSCVSIICKFIWINAKLPEYDKLAEGLIVAFNYKIKFPIFAKPPVSIFIKVPEIYANEGGAEITPVLMLLRLKLSVALQFCGKIVNKGIAVVVGE